MWELVQKDGLAEFSNVRGTIQARCHPTLVGIHSHRSSRSIWDVYGHI